MEVGTLCLHGKCRKSESESQAKIRQPLFVAGFFVLLVTLCIPLATDRKLSSYVSLNKMNLNAQLIFYRSFNYAKFHFIGFPR